MSDPEEIVDRIREQFRVDDDAAPLGVVAQLGLDPQRWLAVAEDIEAGGDPDAPDELNQQPDSDDGELLVNEDGLDETGETTASAPTVWDDADFVNPQAGVWPSELLEREQWMGGLKRSRPSRERDIIERGRRLDQRRRRPACRSMYRV